MTSHSQGFSHMFSGLTGSGIRLRLSLFLILTMLATGLALYLPQTALGVVADSQITEDGSLNETVFSDETIVFENVASENEATSQAEAAPLKITCTYTTPQVGTPTTFTMQGSGGSGNYKYLQNYILLSINGVYTDDADWTRKSYTTDNTFTYTFVAPGTYELRLYVMDMNTYDYARTIFRVTVEGGPQDLTVEQKADELAQAALNAGCITDYDKALFVHDWLIANATYDHALEYDGESGVLLRGKGTCESFYRAYALVLNKLGIRSERAIGNGHVWNRVLLDGSWTHVDATWDADQSLTGSQAYLSHLYFGLTDEMIQEAHNEYAILPGQEATSYANNYYLQSGEVHLWADALCENIRQALEAGQTSFEVATPQSPYPTMYAVMGRAAAYYASHQDWGANQVEVHVQLRGNLHQDSVYQVTVTEKTSEPEPTPSPTPTPTPDPTPGPDPEPGEPSLPDEPSNPDQPTSPDSSGNSGSSSDGNGSSPGGSAEGGDSGNTSSGSTGSTGSTGANDPQSPTLNPPANPHGQWVHDSIGWWYRQTDGAYPRNCWRLIADQWYYFGPSGYMQTGWLQKGAWYYLDSNGAMATGWQRINGAWYYLQPGSGEMQTGWLADGHAWYYLEPSGVMATGWQRIHGSWYYLQPRSGVMHTGWLKMGGTWYYLHAHGAMATGWQQINGVWYYFYASGAMAANTTVGSYRVNANGAWVAS